jgi:hypothetical protein
MIDGRAAAENRAGKRRGDQLPSAPTSGAKVFCFFFSKKKSFNLVALEAV